MFESILREIKKLDGLKVFHPVSEAGFAEHNFRFNIMEVDLPYD